MFETAGSVSYPRLFRSGVCQFNASLLDCIIDYSYRAINPVNYGLKRAIRATGRTRAFVLLTPTIHLKVDNLGGQTDERFVLDLLDATGALVVNGSGFSADPQRGYFRMVYLADEATLEFVFSRLGQFLENRQYRNRLQPVKRDPGKTRWLSLPVLTNPDA